MHTLKNTLILSSLLLLVSVPCKAQVYSVGAYSFGTFYESTSYERVCSTEFPFPPYRYALTKVTEREDVPGLYIRMNDQAPSGDVFRRKLRVQYGVKEFTFPLAPAIETSGDVAGLLTQCATNHGGQLPSNPLPVTQASWIRHSRALEDIIVVDGDRFDEIQKLLEQAWGKPDPDIKATELSVNGRSVTYTPNQIGIILNLTGTPTQTILSIIEKRNP